MENVRKYWWKILAATGVLYSSVWGLSMDIPDREIIHQTMRNLFYHVPMWFAMTIALLVSCIYSIKYLNSRNNEKFDIMASEAVNVALIFGLLGFATGTVWGNYAWGNVSAFMTSEPRIMSAAIALLVYVAYVILRGSMDEEQKRARVSSVYNIFAFVMFIVFLYVVPRLAPGTMHPGVDGNPAFNIYDSDDAMRPVFYIAGVSWILVALWIIDIRRRIKFIERKKLYQ
jgi:heme exporter protein C